MSKRKVRYPGSIMPDLFADYGDYGGVSPLFPVEVNNLAAAQLEAIPTPDGCTACGKPATLVLCDDCLDELHRGGC